MSNLPRVDLLHQAAYQHLQTVQSQHQDHGESPISMNSELYLEGGLVSTPQRDVVKSSPWSGDTGERSPNPNALATFGQVNDLNGLLVDHFADELEGVEEFKEIISQRSQQRPPPPSPPPPPPQPIQQQQQQPAFVPPVGRLMGRSSGGVRRTASQLGESYMDSQVVQIRRETNQNQNSNMSNDQGEFLQSQESND